MSKHASVLFGASSEARRKASLSRQRPGDEAMRRRNDVREGRPAAGEMLGSPHGADGYCISPKGRAGSRQHLRAPGERRIAHRRLGRRPGRRPYAKSAAGNVAAEEVIDMLEGMGVTTGVALDRLISASSFISRVLGRALNSRLAWAKGFRNYRAACGAP